MAKLVKGTVTAVDVEEKIGKNGTFKVVDITVGNVKAGTYLRDIVQPALGDTVEMSYEPTETKGGFKFTKLLGLRNLTLEQNLDQSLEVKDIGGNCL